MITGHVAEFHGPVSTEPLRCTQRYRALAELEYGECIRPSIDKAIIEAIANERRRWGRGLLSPSIHGDERQDRGYKPALYCESHCCQALTLCSRSLADALALKFFVCPV